MPSVRELASTWLEWDSNPSTRAEIESLLEKNDEEELSDRLSKRISFGTAGLRGRMQAGFAYMNDLTVTQASQGLAVYLEEAFGAETFKKKGVVIGYDGRHNSLAFARKTAAVFASRGARVALYSAVVPTPFVPFGVLHQGCVAGVMVTASHNPKQDNGYKVYWENSCQIVSPQDAHISKHIEANLKPWDINVDQLVSSSLVFDPLSDVSLAYRTDISRLFCKHREDNQASDLKIVFTPMHGVGNRWVIEAFEAFSLNKFIEVPLQKDPDPEFSTVTFPNPEEGRGALKLAIEQATANGARLILANDPDSDRLAAAEQQKDGTWKIFNGNEIGALLASWSWKKYKPADVEPSKCVLLNTTVSSKLLSAMAEKEGFTYEETLTGFKWLGTVAQKHMDNGSTFIFAFEEAIGFLIGDISLDKDGVRAAAIFAEMAVQLSNQGLSVADELENIYQKYGYFCTQNSYFFCYDPNVMRTIFGRLREGGYPTKCGEFAIKGVRDLTTGYDNTKPDNKPVLPVSSSSEMVTIYFENGCILTMRGSGTEPKLKYYAEMSGPASDKESVARTLNQVVQAVIEDILQPERNDLKAPASS